MKKLSKIMAIVLAVSIIASLCSIGSLAESKDIDLSKIYNKGTGYVAFGDSITRGYVATDNWKYEGYKIDTVPTEASLELSAYKNISEIEDPTKKQNEINTVKGSIFCRNVKGSFGNYVADELGLSSPDNILIKDARYWPIALDAVTTGFFLDLLGVEDNITDEQFLVNANSMKQRYEAALYYFGDENSNNSNRNGLYGKTGEAVNIHTLVENASLVTVELGMSDVFYRAFDLIARDYGLSNFDNAETILSAVKDLVAYMYEGYEDWKVQFPLLLDYIDKNINDDCTVVVFGLVNSAFGLNISDDVMIPVGSAISIITELMNQTYRELADKYGFIYLDISNTETGIIENDYTITEMLSINPELLGIASHPSANGYKQIARMLINALEENERTYKVSRNNIVVDLGRFSSVDYVKIDGVRVYNYSVENSTLTIPCFNRYAQKLTIAVKNNGKLSVTTYQICYNKGFTATRTYTTNDIVKTVTNSVITTQSVVGKIIKLFRK